jgi:dTDP-4-dehydrorhamnose reductase
LKILLTGPSGQVGTELRKLFERTELVQSADRRSLDLTDPDVIRRVVREAAPDIIVNAAAYTAVDKAETEEPLALQVNGIAPGVMAEEAKRAGALLVHYSTDYVFDGRKPTPYREDDAVNPLSAYGRTKLEGERRIRNSGCRYLIVRTAWVYGNGGNFVRAILRQADKGAALRVVNDQFGAPTWAADIAATTARLLEVEGTFHVTAAGVASWYDVALEILRLTGRTNPVQPVSSAEYGARAPRPRYSVLDNSRLRAAGVEPIGDWKARLAAFFAGSGEAVS